MTSGRVFDDGDGDDVIVGDAVQQVAAGADVVDENLLERRRVFRPTIVDLLPTLVDELRRNFPPSDADVDAIRPKSATCKNYNDA